jgi:hypothetical protein
MKIIPGSRRHHSVARVGVFLIMAALIVGMTGCGSGQCSLTIHCTEGGWLWEPGEGTFNLDYGTVVYLDAEADICYEFVNWTGDVGTIADVEISFTTITMYGSYVITANFTPKVSENPEIRDWYHLDAVRDNPCGNYTLMNDLDSTTGGYEEMASPTANDGKGWQPIEHFVGTFDGQGYEICSLFINCPDRYYVGLFGYVDEGGIIENVGVVNADVTGEVCVGGLVGRMGRLGWSYEGTVTNSYFTGSVTGNEEVGGLVGQNNGSIVSNSHSTGSVTGNERVGGLVGRNIDSSVSDSYSTGSVTGDDMVGGLVGDNCRGTVSDSNSTSYVTGNVHVGGLVGDNYVGSTISNSYSTGSVTGDMVVGGLAGVNWATMSNSYSTGSVNGNSSVGGLLGSNHGTVSNSYSTSSVSGDSGVGGLAGDNHGNVSNCYATGSVTGNSYVGGLVGWNPEIVSNSFWDTQTSGQATSDGGTGKTTAEMQDIATFSGAGWNIFAVTNSSTRNPSYIWNIVDTVTYPFLSWQPWLFIQQLSGE